MDRFNVFILSAGLGERLRPITGHIPKPLLPILGKPVLQYILEKTQRLPVNRIGINLHYMAKEIDGWIKGSPYSEMIEVFYEHRILGTGGALKNAEIFLKACPPGSQSGNGIFLVHNSDIISDMDLGRLVESHLASKNIATLAVHDCVEFNNLIVNKDGYLIEILKSKTLNLFQGKVQNNICETPPLSCQTRFGISKPKAFTGVAVYSTDFLEFLPHGVCSVVDGWLNAISKGFKIGTLNVSGCKWHDTGMPASYARAVFEMLKEEGETLFIHPSSRGCENAILNGYVVIEERSTIGKGIFLKDCIVLPETSIKEGANYEGVIIGDGYTVDIERKDSEDNMVMLGSGGSDRRYYRIRKDGVIRVLMCDNDRANFNRQVEYTIFFKRYSIPVPELISVDHEKMTAIFEDLGDTSLYNWLKCPREDEKTEDIYKKAMDILILLHTEVTENVSGCLILKDRLFDFEYFRWESRYFIESFVRDVMNINIKNYPALEREFDLLAKKADSFPKTVIHRDFQSQNIMITEKGHYIIDYQGARMGPPAYDVASLLWDPYYHLKEEMRQSLLSYYIEGMRQGLRGCFDEDSFMESLITCRLQRHMQALGAYGFLSTKKGRRHFLRYIPEGLRLLKEDIEIVKDDYRDLFNLVTRQIK